MEHSSLGYLLSVLVSLFCYVTVYRTVIFRTLIYDNVILSLKDSYLLLGMLVLVISTVNLAFTWKKKSSWNKHMALMMPFEIYTFLAYRSVLGSMEFVLIWLAVSLCIGFLCSVWMEQTSVKGKLYIIRMRRKLRQSVYGCRSIAAVICAVLPVCICINTVWGISLVAPSHTAETEEYSTLSMELLTRFKDDKWYFSTSSDCMETLQNLADWEREYYGIPYPLTVQICTLDDDTLGAYENRTHIVKVNVSMIDPLTRETGEEVMKTVLHECAHAYTQACIEAMDACSEPYKRLRMFNTLNVMKYEFENYSDADDSFFEYYYQTVEIYARQQSETRMKYYHELLYGEDTYTDERVSEN